MNIVTKDGLNYFWGKIKEKVALLSGAKFTGTVESTKTDVAFKHTNGTSIGFGVGSGKVNRGIWDYTNNKWAVYLANDQYPLLSQSPPTADNSYKVATTGFVKAQGYTTATGHTHSQYLTATSSVKEAYLTWGGKNFSGSYGCIDAAMVNDLGASRLMFGKANGIIVEYSRDNGITWEDYGASDSNKQRLFAQGGAGFVIGKSSTKTEVANENCLLRISIKTHDFGIYTVLNKFVIYVTTNGSQGSWCTIDASYEATPTDFRVFADKVSISGWSGYNVINTSGLTTYGNTPASQYGLVRFTFGCTGHTSTTYAGLQINQIFGFGGTGWNVPSTMAKNGHLYSFDENQNATFPAEVTATKFNGNASTATKLGTSNVGNSAHPIYLKNGVPTTSVDYSIPDNNATARKVLLRPTDADGAGASHHSYSSKMTYVASTDTLTVANLNGKATSALSADSVAWNNITSKPSTYTPPTASKTTLGGIKVGDNLIIDSDGTLSAVSGATGVTINDVYPVGSIYFSINNTNPSTMFGGTWQSVGDNLKLSSTDYFWGGISIYAWKRTA